MIICQHELMIMIAKYIMPRDKTTQIVMISFGWFYVAVLMLWTIGQKTLRKNIIGMNRIFNRGFKKYQWPLSFCFSYIGLEGFGFIFGLIIMMKN